MMRKVPRYICSRVPLNTDADLLRGTLGKDNCVLKGRRENQFSFAQEINQMRGFLHPSGNLSDGGDFQPQLTVDIPVTGLNLLSRREGLPRPSFPPGSSFRWLALCFRPLSFSLLAPFLVFYRTPALSFKLIYFPLYGSESS